MPTTRQLVAAAWYSLAAVVYIVIGVCFTDFLFSVFVGAGYLLLVAWFVPAALRRLL
jgi:hypothetical protein